MRVVKLVWVLLLAGAYARAALAAENPSEPKLVRVPAGKIKTSTCPVGVAICPQHDYVERVVDIPAFEIAETEVTFAEWDACARDGGCVTEDTGWAYRNRPVHPPCVENEACQYPYDESWGRDKRPVINVGWDDVQQYLQWLNSKTNGRYRLPSAEEWEYVALAGSKATYSWGATPGRNKANCKDCGSRWDNRQTAPVASFKPNRFGVFDMHGNVSEWTSSCYPTRSKGSQQCMTYFHRGGDWASDAASLDPRYFEHRGGHFRANYIGVRLAR